MLILVRRAAWGALPPKRPLTAVSSTDGVKVHYLGTHLDPSLELPGNHRLCDDMVRTIQRSHLNHPTEDYNDIAYNYVVCPHGSAYEGRGLHRMTGANGSRELNRRHYAVVCLLGNSGLVKPTDAMLDGVLDVIEHLQQYGDAGDEIRGHRDGHPTACPGDQLYEWIERGAPRPDGDDDQDDDEPKHQAPPFPGRHFFVLGAENDHALKLQQWLHKGNWGPKYKVGPSRQMALIDIRKVAALQAHYLSALGPADGATGPKTWRYAYEVAHGLRKR